MECICYPNWYYSVKSIKNNFSKVYLWQVQYTRHYKWVTENAVWTITKCTLKTTDIISYKGNVVYTFFFFLEMNWTLILAIWIWHMGHNGHSKYFKCNNINVTKQEGVKVYKMNKTVAITITIVSWTDQWFQLFQTIKYVTTGHYYPTAYC